MEQRELKEEVVVSKEQRSRGMNLDKQDHEKELNMKGIDSELSAISQKNEERKVAEAEIEYLTNEFLLSRNKALNLLRKMDLKQAIKHMVHS